MEKVNIENLLKMEAYIQSQEIKRKKMIVEIRKIRRKLEEDNLLPPNPPKLFRQ